MNVEIKEILFSEILPIWSEKLWPLRQSKIEELSHINKFAEIDSSIASYKAKFFAAYLQGEMVGVISCHPVSNSIMRLRGIYVSELYRKSGIGKILVETVVHQAKTNGYKEVFGLVREKNRIFFEQLGFTAETRTDAYEYGPHFIMLLKI